MKLIYILFTVMCLGSCKTSKNKETAAKETNVDNRVLGTVHLQKSGCPVTIEIIEAGSTLMIYPVNLDEKFKVEGLKLKFIYNLSKAPSPMGCKADRIVSLEDVSAYR